MLPLRVIEPATDLADQWFREVKRTELNRSLLARMNSPIMPPGLHQPLQIGDSSPSHRPTFDSANLILERFQRTLNRRPEAFQ